MQKDWWNKEVFLGLTRNDLPFIVLGMLIVVLYFGLDWHKVYVSAYSILFQ